MKKLEFQNEPVIFTTGAFLKPTKVIDSQGKKIWIWRVSEFVDDSFKDGKIYNPSENAETLEKLVSE